MTNRIILFFLSACISICSVAQGLVDKSADNGLMVRQIPGSESDAVSYFSNLPVDGDTIYATIFRPGNCPRCDALLNTVNHYFKKCTDKPSVLIAVYPDSTISKEYIARYDLKADHYMFDTNEDFAKIFNFSPGYLHVGYILKMNVATGELIVGSNADMVTQSFMEELNNYSHRKPPHLYLAEKNVAPYPTDSVSATLSADKTLRLIYPSDMPKFSEVIYQPLFNGDNLLWNDKLLYAVYHFQLQDSTARLRNIFEANPREARTFVNLPEERYQRLLQDNLLKNIPLQPFVIDNDKIGVAYSLPEVWADSVIGLCYRNMPCYIVRSLSDDGYNDIVPIKLDYEDDFFYYQFYLKKCGKNNVVLGAQRLTWPMLTDRAEYETIEEKNPFTDGFYDNYAQPTLALYNTVDSMVGLKFGTLPDFAKRTKTGYCFSEMVFNSYGDEAVYASIYDGNIYVSDIESLDCRDCTKNYKAFNLDMNLFQEPDTALYHSYDCNALAEPLLHRRIDDVKCDGEHIHCLLRYSTDAFNRPSIEKYQYIMIDRLTGARTVYDFPAPAEHEQRMSYGLRRLDNGSVQPYYLSKDAEGWWLTLTKLATVA